MKTPNLFLAGAPKCGTTALSEYLRGHPQVFMCTPKEPSYFSEDLPGLRYVTRLEDYLRLFAGAGDRQVVAGDASPSYLFSHTAVAAIHRFNPAARLIVTFRDPMEMLPSYHGQLVYSLFEDQTDLARAWTLQEERSRGRHIPPHCREPAALRYNEIAAFADQLERVYEVFPRGQVLPLLYEEFRADTRGSYARVLEFLGLPDDQRHEFPVINPAKNPRLAWLNHALHHPPNWSKRLLGRLAGTRAHDLIIRGHALLKRVNSQRASKPSLDPVLARAIRETYLPQVRRLEALLGRDLGHWLRAGGGGRDR